MGDRFSNLMEAIDSIEVEIGKVFKKSSIYVTEAWGNTDQKAFLNQALSIRTRQNGLEILSNIQKIEKKMGRVRTVHWGPRLIDIDIIFLGKSIINLPKLKIPHPLMHKRKFVLIPSNEIASHFTHPILKKQIRTLLKNCKDESEVTIYNE